MTLTPTQREFRLQLAVIKHLDSAFKKCRLQYCHIPNRPGNATDGYFKKMMGSQAGAADLILGWPVYRQGVTIPQAAYIELKAPEGRVTSAQNKFLSSWAAIGWKTAVCHSVKGVHHTLCMWGLSASHTSIMEPDYSTKQEKLLMGQDWQKPL